MIMMFMVVVFRFYILLQADAKGTGDKVFRLRGLVQQSSLIVDYYSDFWNYEQEQYSPTVIRPNMTIELKLRREPTHIEILLNGAFISPFFYPEGYFFIDAIRMGGDILVHDVVMVIIFVLRSSENSAIERLFFFNSRLSASRDRASSPKTFPSTFICTWKIR